MSDIVPIRIGLHAVVVATDAGEPMVLTVPQASDCDRRRALPFGPFDPAQHRTMETGLRQWVNEQTGLALGYVEQLYTFGDRGRLAGDTAHTIHFVSVGYLALARKSIAVTSGDLGWNRWYRYFPWEDWRQGCPGIVKAHILPAMARWVLEESPDAATRTRRLERLRFALNWDAKADTHPDGWDEERVLERYELLYEAGLVDESVTDGRYAARRIDVSAGDPLAHDHRRILATAIARLRGKLKYRPVVFELMPDLFTLTELQLVVENLSGRRLHKQNFRRMVERSGLVEITDKMRVGTGGRPAAYYRFISAVARDRPLPGLRV